ncbi:MAG: hypothetical protein AB9919_08985 [Geobacteraceae bacterium]
MFIENKMLNFIEADAQDVVAMYRSNSTVMLEQRGKQRQPCEAFICVTNDGDSTLVYVALSLLYSKSFVVFVPERQPLDKEARNQLLVEAQDFVKKFGFEMQSINLNYSKALKEVVLNDLRVVRSATTGKKAALRKGVAEKISRQQQDVPEKTPGSEDKSSGKVKTADLEQNKKAAKAVSDTSLVKEGRQASPSLKSVPAQDTAVSEEQERKERLVADREKAEKEASQALALLRDDNKRLEKELAVFQEKSKSEIDALQAELVVLGRRKVAAEAQAGKETAKLEKESQRLSEQVAAQEKSTVDKLSPLAAEIEKLSRAKNAAEKDATRKIAEAKAEIDSLRAANAEYASGTAVEIQALQAELEQLNAAKTSAEKVRAREIAVLKTELDGLLLGGGTNQELAALKDELERRRTEKSALENHLQNELSGLQGQRVDLEKEITTIEVRRRAELAVLRAELEEATREKQRLSGEVEQELVSLREDIARLRAVAAGARETAAEERAKLAAEQQKLLREKEETDRTAELELSRLRTEIIQIAEKKKSIEDSCADTCAELNGELERLAAENASLQQEFKGKQTALQERISQLKEEIDAARLANENLLNSLRLEAEQLLARKAEVAESTAAEISSREKELSLLKKAADSDRSEKERIIAELKSKIDSLSAGRVSLEEITAQEIASLTAEEEQLARQMLADEAAAAEELAKVQSRLALIQCEIKNKNDSAKEALTTVTSEIEKLENESGLRASETSAYMASLKARVLQFADDLLQVEKQAAEKTQTARKTALSLIAALSGDEKLPGEYVVDSDMESWLAALQEEADQLLAEKSALENTSTDELAMLRAKVTSLAAEKNTVEKNLAREREALHAEAERLAAEKAAAEQAAEKVLKEISAEVARLVEEKTTAETLLEESISTAKIAARKLSDEKAELKARIVQQSCLLEESITACAGLPEEIPVPDVVPTTKMAGSVSRQAQPSPGKWFSMAADDGDESDCATRVLPASDETDPFAFLQQEGAFEFGIQPKLGRKSSSKPVNFSLDKSKTRVVYQRPEDMMEIYKSLNRTRVAREDNTTVTCDAYVFSVREDGLPRVYIAFYLVDLKEAMVYVPEKQPENEEELAAVMSDGFDFIEIVGFMMDPMDLGDKTGRRIARLEKIPALQRMNAAEG